MRRHYGRAVPDYTAEVRDPDGNTVKPGESGRLWMKGGSAAAYYWNSRRRQTAETMVGGWLDTGDTYRQDDDGYYIYEGRSDDMLKVGGIWCSPVEIEGCLIGHPAVLESAVVGRADADGLVKPQAFIVLKPGHDAGAKLTIAVTDDSGFADPFRLRVNYVKGALMLEAADALPAKDRAPFEALGLRDMQRVKQGIDKIGLAALRPDYPVNPIELDKTKLFFARLSETKEVSLEPLREASTTAQNPYPSCKL